MTSIRKEDYDDGNQYTHQIADNQWNTMIAARQKDGYREGVTAGKEEAMQQGFDKGYQVGFSCVRKVAKLRGFLWAIIGIIKCNQSPVKQEETKALEQLHDIIKALMNIEQKLIKYIRNVKEGTTASDILQQSASFNISDAARSADTREDFGNSELQSELDDLKKLCINIFRCLKLEESLIMRLND